MQRNLGFSKFAIIIGSKENITLRIYALAYKKYKVLHTPNITADPMPPAYPMIH
jgi:hypothetical protein